MPNVTFNGNTYSCTKAYKGSDFVHLVDGNGVLIVAFDGVSDFSGFSITNGSWSVPSEKNCCLATFNEDGTISRGGTVISSTVGTYAHSANGLTGSGENGRFKATTTGTISSIEVNGTACSVKCGEETSVDLIAGNWYTFILDGNTVNFNAGGAGGGLNFKVVGGTSAPASPKENMIWVNTSVTITSWHFGTDEPNYHEEGTVWITTGASSPVAFNALKKNSITVYPISAKVFSGGMWWDLEAKSYHNGAWVDWFLGTWLYNGGSVNESLTGGWQTPSTAYDIIFSFTSEGITATEANNDKARDAAAYTNNRIDVTKYNWLIAEKVSVRQHSSNKGTKLNYFTIGLTDQNTANTHEEFVVEERISTEMSDAEVKINISGVSGSYYIGLQADVACGTVDKLYLIE